jgi:hypothetical protein
MRTARSALWPGAPVPDEIQRLERECKVGALTVLRRPFDAA